MPFWKIHLLGTESISSPDGKTVTIPDIGWLFIGSLLSAPRRSISRSRLAAEIWPEKTDEAARHCLATALWRIRRRLPCHERLIRIRENQISLNLDRGIWVDMLAMEHRARRAISEPERLNRHRERRKLLSALALYGGDFMMNRDHDGIIIERERLRALFLDANYELACANARHADWPATISICRTLCAIEPLREDAQRLLIEAYIACGQRAMAVQQYREFEALLARDLDVRPMPETRALVAQTGEAEMRLQHPLPEDFRTALVQTREQMKSALVLIDSVLGS